MKELINNTVGLCTPCFCNHIKRGDNAIGENGSGAESEFLPPTAEEGYCCFALDTVSCTDMKQRKNTFTIKSSSIFSFLAPKPSIPSSTYIHTYWRPTPSPPISVIHLFILSFFPGFHVSNIL